MDAILQRIRKSFDQPLPGRAAQYEMAHAFRGTYPEFTKDARKAGVLILLYPKNNDWHVVFIQRPGKNPNDRHAGQLSFPGGKFEIIDTNLQQTALRETAEEVGADTSNIEILGALTPLFIPVSNFLVSPFVGFTTQSPSWTPQESEVEEIIEFSLASFFKPETKGLTEIKIRKNIRLQQVPFFDLNGKKLWGATAMMMNEFLMMDWSV